MPHFEISLFKLHVVEGVHVTRNLTNPILFLEAPRLQNRLLLDYLRKVGRTHFFIEVIFAELPGEEDQEVRVALSFLNAHL